MRAAITVLVFSALVSHCCGAVNWLAADSKASPTAVFRPMQTFETSPNAYRSGGVYDVMQAGAYELWTSAGKAAAVKVADVSLAYVPYSRVLKGDYAFMLTAQICPGAKAKVGSIAALKNVGEGGTAVWHSMADGYPQDVVTSGPDELLLRTLVFGLFVPHRDEMADLGLLTDTVTTRTPSMELKYANSTYSSTVFSSAEIRKDSDFSQWVFKTRMFFCCPNYCGGSVLPSVESRLVQDIRTGDLVKCCLDIFSSDSNPDVTLTLQRRQ